MGATRKKQQLDVGLSGVKDPATRAALNSIVTFVNQMSQGISTGGAVKSDTFKTHKDSFTVDDQGSVVAKSFTTKGQIKALGFSSEGGPEFRVWTFTGTLGPLDDQVISAGTGYILMGVFGFTTRAGDLAIWRPIPYAYPSGQGIVWESDTTAGSTNTVRIRSTDSTDDNEYRIIAFYTES